MAWNLKGQLLETCSCDLICPCWFRVKELQVMDQGWRAGAVLFRIHDGSSGGVTLGGRVVVMGVHMPGPTMFDGNGTVRFYIDDGATPDQSQELDLIFSGARGGPMERFVSLITNRLPSQTVAIQVQDDGQNLIATVSDIGQVRAKPMTSEAGNPVMMQNAGPLGLDTVRIAPSASQWADPDLPQRFETKSGGVGNFAWSGN